MADPQKDDDSVDLTPMIDVVFLLLIFFMVTMQIVQEERELIVPFPSATVDTPDDFDLPPQVIDVEIDMTGQVVVDGLPKDDPSARNLNELTSYFLQQGQVAMRDPDSTVIVNIKPEDLVAHKYTTNVLNALSKANNLLDEMQESRPSSERKLLTKIMFH